MDINKAKILLCDDSVLARTQLKDVIRIFGAPMIFEAEDGADAVRIFEKERPNLVFLDLIMPNVNGSETLKQILDIDKEAKVVIVTSIDNREILLETIKLGAREFIQKPFSELQIINALTKNLVE